MFPIFGLAGFRDLGVRVVRQSFELHGDVPFEGFWLEGLFGF